MSIARMWTGSTKVEDADRYLDYLRRTGIADSWNTPGNEAVWCLRRIDRAEAEFTFISVWKDLRSVESFAGPDPERAVFYPQDEAFLVRRDERVTHYEVLFRGSTPSRPGAIERFVGWWTRKAAAALPAPRANAKGPPAGGGGAPPPDAKDVSGSVAA